MLFLVLLSPFCQFIPFEPIFFRLLHLSKAHFCLLSIKNFYYLSNTRQLLIENNLYLLIHILKCLYKTWKLILVQARIWSSLVLANMLAIFLQGICPIQPLHYILIIRNYNQYRISFPLLLKSASILSNIVEHNVI